MIGEEAESMFDEKACCRIRKTKEEKINCFENFYLGK